MKKMEIKKNKTSWGFLETYIKNKKCTIKKIFIKKGKKTPTQCHKNKDKYWLGITCGMKVQLGENIFHLDGGDRIYIPRDTKHRAWREDEEYGNDGFLLEISIDEIKHQSIEV